MNRGLQANKPKINSNLSLIKLSIEGPNTVALDSTTGISMRNK